jgi:O-antigen/teichoic acid export membrane protein
LLGANLHVLYIVMAAALMRICADGYSYVLYAQSRDEAIAATSVGGTALSAALNLLLIPFAKLPGAGIAFLVTASAQFGARFLLSRQPLPDAGAVRSTTAA